MRKAKVTRFVDLNESHNFYGKAVGPGVEFYEFRGTTYGCINYNGGIALSERPGENPFFEFPSDAIEWIE